MKNIKIYEVGGSVRDSLLGLKSKDRDFCVIASSYEDMKNYLIGRGAKIFLEKPEYVTIRCKLEPYGDCDFVLGRKEGYYGDGRRPDSVSIVDSIEEELSRRDFTINAMAIDEDGNLIDPFNGKDDLLNKHLLACVGGAEARFKEDSLRMLRAIRFAITKRLSFSDDIYAALQNKNMIDLLDNISIERIREELYKCFYFDTPLTLRMITQTFPYISANVLNTDKLWLEPTLKERSHIKR